jgi:hypothetical protein
MSVTYPDAQTRGRLRLWKQGLAKQYAKIEYALDDPALSEAIADMVKRGSRTGKERALAKIQQRIGSACQLEIKQLDKWPYAVFSLLRPRGSVLIEEDGKPTEGAMAQDCVTVNYIAVGCLPGKIGIAEGLWSIEVPDHALGRAIERSEYLHPGVIVREAHRSLMALPVSVIEHPSFSNHEGRGALIKAGPGAFAAQIWAAADVSLGGAIGVHVRARTWLSDDQLHDDQTLLEPGKEGERLGDVWLRPMPFRRIVREGGRLTAYRWAERMEAAGK